MAKFHKFRFSDGVNRPEYVEALKAIVNLSDPVVMSWGIDPNKDNFICTTHETLEDANGDTYDAQNTALYFFVDGYQYTGRVLLLYNEALDVFEIYKAKAPQKGIVYAEEVHTDVYLSDARRLLDEMIETGGNMEEYQSKIKEQTATDPLYNFVGQFLSDDDKKKVYVSSPNEAGGVNTYTFEKVTDGDKDGVKISED